MTARVERPDGTSIELRDDVLEPYRDRLAGIDAAPVRLAYAAAHIVMLPGYADADPMQVEAHIDWVATMRHRRFLADNGFGIAEAMDTAQRFETGWAVAQRLIDETARAQFDTGFVAGAGIDHVDEPDCEEALIEAVAWQCDYIASRGGIPVVLSLPWLTQRGYGEDDFVRVYRGIIDAVDTEIILHWLGPMFLPTLEGNFPGASMHRILEHDPARVRALKLSMLDAKLESGLRVEMAGRDQVMFTGDDWNFADLIEGGGEVSGETTLGGRRVPTGDFSHALLGIFDGIAEPAGLALKAMAIGDVETYRTLMRPCEALSRVIFEEPVGHYKAGLAFLSWVNGRQSNPMLPCRLEQARDMDHHQRLLAAASEAGVLRDVSLVMRLLGG